MKSIQKMLPSLAVVVRNGVQDNIPINELVPGDIVNLVNGSSVPADVRILSANSLKVDQSMLTGESEPIKLTNKSTNIHYLETRNITFSGGTIVQGNGKGIVVSTGNQTIMGSLAFAAYVF